VRLAAPAALAVALALAVAGCADDGPTDRQQIETTILTYYKAFGKGDTGGACNELSKDTKTALEKAGRGKDCTEILDAALKRPDYAAITPKLQNARVTRITIANDKASAAVLIPGVKDNGALGARTTVPLLKEGGAWKIVGAPQ
jgi:hypothetical protein